jgi:hypothetical protein
VLPIVTVLALRPSQAARSGRAFLGELLDRVADTPDQRAARGGRADHLPAREEEVLVVVAVLGRRRRLAGLSPQRARKEELVARVPRLVAPVAPVFA